MTISTGASAAGMGLQSRQWLFSYKTSSTMIDGRPVDMLRDFYIPAISLANRYDRVAGYFRSSSLAAASQGFSAFVGRNGKMRLIVGADLEPADVRAILEGDSRRLAARLNDELEQPGEWPQGVRNGVTLLAWMVAHGYLDVRVAFRVHGKTGEPLPFESVEDGYVHEKWFIMHDEYGNRMYGTGTLNESKTALVLNAENIDIHCDWWGEMDRRRVEQAVADFDNLWRDKFPHMRVLTLPDAVRRRLIRLAEGVERPVEIDGTSAAPPVVEPPPALERLRFAVLRDAPRMPGGRFVGMETAPVAPWPHQAVVVRRLVETWPYSYLLCDEVGLGKTIEAGLAFRSLYLSGLARRILIACPAGLTRQWQRQMASKVLLSFGRVRTGPEIAHEYIFPVEENRPARSIFEPGMVIISTGLLARQERAMALVDAPPFDIALVDEAHAARRRNPSAGLDAHPDYGQLYIAIRDYLRRQSRGLWLATATPMQIHPVEVCDLLALTNRVGAFQFDPTLTLQYYEVLGKIVHDREPSKQEWEFLRRAVQAVETQDPILWYFIRDYVIDGRIRTAVRQWLEDGRVPRGRDRRLMCRLIFSASPLSRVMMRHSRRLLEIYRDKGQLKQNLARRHVESMPGIQFNSREKRIYDKLEEYCRGLAAQIRACGDSQAQQMVSFLLSFLRLRFASSFYAIRETLKRRLEKVEATLKHQLVLEAGEPEPGASYLEEMVTAYEEEGDQAAVESLLKNRTPADLEWEREHLQKMLDEMADLTGLSSKMQVLLDRLDRRRDRHTGRIRQTVVFTRFYDTLVDIVNRLRLVNPGMLVGTYSGQGAECYDPDLKQMTRLDREEVKERFLREEIDVLVCTDAAAEGLNLQTADLLVNFDMGWNPMKVEQRIGRIDRIGQKHNDIYVLNLCYAGSAEETVYVRLLRRLEEASLIVGTQQISLLPVEPEDFRKLAEGQITPEELEREAAARLEEQRRRSESMEMHPEELYEIYRRLENGGARKTPVDLHAIWETLCDSRYLRSLGCAVTGEKGKQLCTLSGIQGVQDGAVLTVSRDLYEKGVAGSGARVHFASYGDPVFDALLEQVNSFDLPSCARRISVPVPGMEGVEMVAYAVACRDAGDTRAVRLVLSWDELQSIEPAEGETLSGIDVEPLREELRRLARDEFEHYLAAGRIERLNTRAAYAQKLLNYYVIYDLLGVRARHAGDGALFWPVLREVGKLFEERGQVSVTGLPAGIIRTLEGELLFKCRVPAVGDKVDITAPSILGRAAVDAASRLANKMKKGKGKLLAGTVMASLRREIETMQGTVG